ncbi:hypothetical protein H072_8737 [Dactylellina haptotyla CBS 200.50]|uniref:Glycosyltransferase 2-like domain-containing protein n=1 Tax=Dactylellina haptotyla (strain CBS 200.50) TaxID=1284197 RepID=S8BQN2_DACHA|nr:hypothetical protein H072_8737 [Dactylellina haptotyla CBS 200.50]
MVPDWICTPIPESGIPTPNAPKPKLFASIQQPPQQLYRYTRLIVNCIASWTFRPIPLPEKPTYKPEDATLVIPTIDGEGQDFVDTLARCLETGLKEIIIVTIKRHQQRLEDVASKLDPNRIRVFAIRKANKRKQMVKAIPEVKTKILIFADDDIMWPKTFLPWILAPFENPKIGGAGTSQRLKRTENRTFWTILGAFYLERRNFEFSATTHMDGGVSCLSGRTVAYRTKILQDKAFMDGFTNELWRGQFALNTDDDNFLTRWIVSHGWDSYEQCHDECELRTTLSDDSKFLKQCLRWARSNWRSNYTSMFKEQHIWTRQPWCSYALHMATFNPPALISDFGLLYLLYKATAYDTVLQQQCMVAQFIWLLFTKVVKLLPHFWRYPSDIRYLPISILFGYFHGFIKYYALFTLNETAWGSREGVDDSEDKEEEPFSYNRIDGFDVENGSLLDEKLITIALAT